MFLRFPTRFNWPVFTISFEELEKRSHHLLILLAVTVITYAMVGLAYDVLSLKLLRNREIRPAAVEATPAGSISKEPAESYAVIPQRNLFGTTDKVVVDKALAAPPPVEGPDISTLLEIKGTVAGTGKDGFVIIEEKGKNKQFLYKVGSVVAGTKILRIDRNAVVFSTGNREKTLKVPDMTQSPLTPPGSGVSSPVVAPQGSGPMVINRAEVDASLKDMGTMLSQAQIRPYYSEGLPDGFMIGNIRPGSIYQKIGLAEGDIIQGAGDRRLTTADDLTALYNSLKGAPSVTLRIKRGGQQQTLQYVFR